MTPQKEKPGITAEQLAKMTGRDSAEGILCSGNMFENFKEGWAISIFSDGEKGHYFTRRDTNIGQVVSKCGFVQPVSRMYGMGNYPKCKRCLKARK